MYWLRASCRCRERLLVVAVLGCLSGCGENILVARELDELQVDAAAPSLVVDAGSRRKQAINAERARARLRGLDDDKHDDDKRQ